MEPFAIIGTIVDCINDYDWNLRIEKQGLLVIDHQGKIVYKGKSQDLSEAKNKFNIESVIELENKNEFLLPGFIDSHIHAAQYPNAGLGLDLPLLEWLNKYTFPMERRYGEDLQFAKKAYEAVVKSTLNHGTTTASYFATIDVDASLILAEVAENLGQWFINILMISPILNILKNQIMYPTMHVHISMIYIHINKFQITP